MEGKLWKLLEQINAGMLDAWTAHCEYEALHPFTDGNGRSGRAIWLWLMHDASLGFLHRFITKRLENIALRRFLPWLRCDACRGCQTIDCAKDIVRLHTRRFSKSPMRLAHGIQAGPM